MGGWDTHVNQAPPGQLANKLAALGQGLAALADGLGDSLRDTVIVVASEFGRTVRQNGTGGTDHGRGNVMWLLGGPGGRGKVLGEWPGLDTAALAEGRDPAVVTDFRQVLAPVLQRHLGLSGGAGGRCCRGCRRARRAACASTAQGLRLVMAQLLLHRADLPAVLAAVAGG